MTMTHSDLMVLVDSNQDFLISLFQESYSDHVVILRNPYQFLFSVGFEGSFDIHLWSHLTSFDYLLVSDDDDSSSEGVCGCQEFLRVARRDQLIQDLLK